MIFAHFHLPGERLQWTKLLGALLGLAGVAVICSKVLDVQGDLAFQGGLAIVVGAGASAYANVLTKLRGRGFAPAVLAAWQMLFGLGPLVLLATWREGNPLLLNWTLLSVSCLLYLALFGSALAFLLFYWLLRWVAVTKLQTIALVTPPVAVALGWLVKGEKLSQWAFLGAGFILAGMSLIFWRVPGRAVPGAIAVPAATES
jgi:drug/metabolite transporter (DMT)-like permease